MVHSLKDMPCQTMPDGLVIAGVPEREDPSDALVLAKRWQNVKFSLDDLPDESVIGTSSLRRISQLKQKYPKLKFETIRGNLQTRFAKLDDKENKFDAIILATSGLKRMGYEDRITMVISTFIIRDKLIFSNLNFGTWLIETALRCLYACSESRRLGNPMPCQ